MTTAVGKTPKSKKKLRFQTPKMTASGKSQQTLPAKKRKINFESPSLTSPPSAAWVGSLTTLHKRKISNNEALCSDVMNAVQAVLKQQFSHMNGLHNTERAPVWDEKEKRWIYKLPFERTMSPAAQIHHTGKFHWVASVYQDGQVYVLDSMSNGTLSPSMEIQLAALYGRDMPCLSVKIPKIQQQTNGVDCGLFAIANVVQACFGGAPGKQLITYNTNYLRDHLIYCLERQDFSPFPKHDTKEKSTGKSPTFWTSVAIAESADCPTFWKKWLVATPDNAVYGFIEVARTRQAMMETTGFVRHIGCR